MTSPKLRQRILAELEQIRTVDCHSHTHLRSQYYKAGGFDLFSMGSYFDRDIESTAGPGFYDGAATDEEKWERLKAVLAKSGNVSYWRHNIVTYQKLFGLAEDDLTDANWRKVNDAIRKKTRDPKWYDHVTRDVCNLETQVRNIPWFEDWEPEHFTGILRMEGALDLHRKETRQSLEKHQNITIHNMAKAKIAIYTLVQDYVKRGIIGIKLAHAYYRTLHSVPAPERDAERALVCAIEGGHITDEELKALQDHIIFYLADICREKGLVFQIHTGVQGNWGNIPDSDPLLLIPLIKSFPTVRFDLFHAGYPYSRMMGMLGKHYPNVWLNMAWMYVISMAASRQVLLEWLDLTPGYRILGFGSDVRFPELVYGHLVMARSCVADALASKVENDFLSEDAAIGLAKRMFRDNAMELYGIKARG